jgi:hypothetical protein
LLRIKAAFILAIALVPAITLAHGGMRQIGGDVIVTNFQTPLSPLVGEKVTSTFVLTDREYHRLPGKTVTLTLIDTFHGDESRDQTILTQQFNTDANGQIEFAHTFGKANYFDYDLAFADTTGAAQTVGFLVQTRTAAVPLWAWPVGVMAVGLGAAVGAWLGLRRRRRR